MVLDSLVSAVFMCCWFYPLMMNSLLNSSHPECDVGYWGLGTFPFPSGLVQNSRFWWTLYLLVKKDVQASPSPNDLLITMYFLKLKRVSFNTTIWISAKVWGFLCCGGATLESFWPSRKISKLCLLYSFVS